MVGLQAHSFHPHRAWPAPEAIGRSRRTQAGAVVRRLRLWSGCALFFYVTTHLLNHTLGLVSLPVMEAGLAFQKLIWQGVVGTAVLYTALTVHFFLGLWAFYERRSVAWRPMDLTQLVLGLTVPTLLANHVAVTRIALAAFNLDKTYGTELYTMWVALPWLGIIQVAALIVAWAHGCIGIYASLRLKPWFGRWRAPLLAGAVLLPALALLGFEEGARIVARLALDPAWNAANLYPERTGTATQVATLFGWRNLFLYAYGAVLLAILAARALRRLVERRRGVVGITYPNGRTIRVPTGTSVLDASRRGRLAHASVCGGRGRCSTCRVRVLGRPDAIPPPSAAERAVLERVRADPAAVRLACQLRPLGDVGVMPLLDPTTAAAFVAGHRQGPIGEERFVVAFFADMRGSTHLAKRHLPYDSVFLLGRFISAVAGAVVQAGGLPNQIMGDGVLALFGLEGEGAAAEHVACAQALSACGLVAEAVARFNRAFRADLAEPVAFGIGVAAGRAIVGEIGFDRHVTFTALGEPVNDAARLQDLTRELGCAALVSAEVFRLARYHGPPFPERMVELRGRGQVAACPFDAGALPRLAPNRPTQPEPRRGGRLRAGQSEGR